MAKPLPMPIELVLDHPRMRTAGAVVASSVLNLACRYWLDECRSLPDEAHDRMVLARSNAPAWARHSQAIEEALREILPHLKQAREDRIRDMEERRARQARGYARQLAEGRAPHLSPHHISKRRKRPPTAQELAAHAALEAAGIEDRRLSDSELASRAVIAHRATRVDLSTVAGLSHGNPTPGSHATPATPSPPPAATLKQGMRETNRKKPGFSTV